LSGLEASGTKSELSFGLGSGGLEVAKIAAVVDRETLGGTGGFLVVVVVDSDGVVVGAVVDNCEAWDCVRSSCGGFGGSGLISIFVDTLLCLLLLELVKLKFGVACLFVFVFLVL